MSVLQEDEVEDVVGEVKYTDSQKSVTTSAVYSFDFTDSSPDRNNSSGKETYVIECDDSDGSGNTFQIHKNESIVNLNDKAMSPVVTKPDVTLLYDNMHTICQYVPTKWQCLAYETFTQTSKTIIELAHNESIVHKSSESKTLETQTSLLCLPENQTSEKKIHENESICGHSEKKSTKHNDIQSNTLSDVNKTLNPITQTATPNDTDILALKKTCTSYKESKTENKADLHSVTSSDENVIRFIDDESNETEDPKQTQYETTSEFDSSKFDSDIDDDSLMEHEYRSSRMSRGDNASDTSETEKSMDNDVEELYNKLIESPILLSPITSIEPCVQKFGTLTPLTEETLQRKASILDLTPSAVTLIDSTKDTDSDTLFVNSAGVKVKMFPNDMDGLRDHDPIKLPPIHKNRSCPNSPHLNFSFSVNASLKPLGTPGNLPCLYENHNAVCDRWRVPAAELASGESPLISGRSEPVRIPKDFIHLPPIHVEGTICNSHKKINFVSPTVNRASNDTPLDAISIKHKIKELKMMTSNKMRAKGESRSCSPTSISSREDNRLCDAAEKGCDNLCIELLRRLRSSSWVDVTETLEDIPKSLHKFWSMMTVHRIADLLRQVIVHIESPRTQVARTACNTLSEILINTNYTRKPDFYEAISILLTKTGSFSRPVRRAANFALDDIICSVDLMHSVTAVCIYGVGHKSALVRCASARLLVVCCALAEGGRQILRSRPPSAVSARQHVMRALAALLPDKNIDTRKYAQRLYAILRPLPNFETYFLTDVDVELAGRHMKKYDQILFNTKQPQ